MERPIAYVGFAFLAGLLAAFFLGLTLGLILIAVAALALVLAAVKKAENRPLSLAACSFIAAVILGIVVSGFYFTNYQKLGGKVYQVKGVVASTMENSCALKVTQLDGEKKSFSLLLYLPPMVDLRENQIISCNVKFYKEDNSEFGRAWRNRASGYQASGTIKGLDQIERLGIKEQGLYSFIQGVKKSCINAIEQMYKGSPQGIVKAMVLGNKQGLSEEINQSFRLAGASHILVVSGMHLSVMAGVLMLLLKKAPRRLAVIIAVIAVVFYILITGAGKSVLRSGIMYIVMLVGMMIGQEGDSMNSLGFSVLLICIFSPYSAVDLGFLLSVSATAGIILFAKNRGKPKAPKLVRGLLAALRVSVGAFLLSYPILLFAFGSINPLSIVTSVFLALPSSVVLVLGFTSVALFFIFPPLGQAAAFLCALAADFMLWVTKLVEVLGRELPVLYGDYGKLLFICVGVITIIVLIRKPNKKALCAYAVAVAMVMVSAFASSYLALNRQVVLVVEDTGKGIEAFLSRGENAFVLSANKSYLPKSLSTRGIKNIKGICLESQGNIKFNPLLENSQIYRSQDYGVSAVASFEQWQINLELGGELIILTNGEKKIVIEKRRMDTKIKADLLLTEFADTKINSDFTMLWSDDTISMNTVVMPVEKEAYGISLNNELEVWREK